MNNTKLNKTVPSPTRDEEQPIYIHTHIHINIHKHTYIRIYPHCTLHSAHTEYIYALEQPIEIVLSPILSQTHMTIHKHLST